MAWSGPLHLVDLELFNIFYEIIKVSNAFVVHPKNAFVVHPKNCKLLIWKNYFLPKYVCKSSLCRSLRGCLVNDFKQSFLIFKQHFTHFNALFYPHVFSQMFLNNNFQFLNICTKRTLNLHLWILISKSAIQIDTYQMEI